MLQRRLAFMLEMIEMQQYVFVVINFVLLWDNFKYSEFVYHFAFEEFFKRNQVFFSDIHDKVSTYFDNNWKSWYEYIKATVAGIILSVAKLLPAQVQPILNVFLSSVNQYQQRSLKASKAFAAGEETQTEISEAESVQDQD